MLAVSALKPADIPAWQALVQRSPNATLFHDLDFLAYHRSTLAFHHLVVRSDGNLVAIVPGGVVDGNTWRSPVGASIGGPAFASRAAAAKAAIGRPRLDDVMSIVEAIIEHARTQQWTSVEMTLPPSVYHGDVGDLIAFALVRHGFREAGRSLSPMIDLDLDRIAALARRSPDAAGDGAPADALFEKRQLQALQGAQERGITTSRGGLAELTAFAPVFEETYERLATKPTHSLDDLEFLLRQFPDRLHLELAQLGGQTLAALFVMRLTDDVAVTTYICSTSEGRQAGAVVLAIASLLQRLRGNGCRWLDLGPSATEHSTNSGVMLFKEGLGGVGYCRTRWACAL